MLCVQSAPHARYFYVGEVAERPYSRKASGNSAHFKLLRSARHAHVWCRTPNIRCILIAGRLAWGFSNCRCTSTDAAGTTRAAAAERPIGLGAGVRVRDTRHRSGQMRRTGSSGQALISQNKSFPYCGVQNLTIWSMYKEFDIERWT